MNPDARRLLFPLTPHTWNLTPALSTRHSMHWLNANCQLRITYHVARTTAFLTRHLSFKSRRNHESQLRNPSRN